MPRPPKHEQTMRYVFDVSGFPPDDLIHQAKLQAVYIKPPQEHTVTARVKLVAGKLGWTGHELAVEVQGDTIRLSADHTPMVIVIDRDGAAPSISDRDLSQPMEPGKLVIITTEHGVPSMRTIQFIALAGDTLGQTIDEAKRLAGIDRTVCDVEPFGAGFKLTPKRADKFVCVLPIRDEPTP